MSVSSCHSYAFADEHVANTDQPSAFGNPLNAQRLKEAIQTNMAAKGIEKAADRNISRLRGGICHGHAPGLR